MFPKISKKEQFENDFSLTHQLWGQKFDSLDDLTNALTTQIPNIKFFDYTINLQKSDNNIFVHEPFSYIVAKIGSEKIDNIEPIGFIIDSEKKFRIGPPYLEEKFLPLAFGNTHGYVLYESSEKKYHLLTDEN